MSLQIFRRPLAKRDIEDAFVFIGAANEAVAFKFLSAVQETLETIAAAPEIGVRRNFKQSALQGIRMWRVKSFEKYLIFYFVREQFIEVVRLVHTSRDFKRVLSSGDN